MKKCWRTNHQLWARLALLRTQLALTGLERFPKPSRPIFSQTKKIKIMLAKKPFIPILKPAGRTFIAPLSGNQISDLEAEYEKDLTFYIVLFISFMK